MKPCSILCAGIVVFAFFLGTTYAHAESYTFKRGQDKSAIFSCDNPEFRTDGTPLDVSEIALVRLYIDPKLGNTATPLFTLLMSGGCQPKSVDLQQFPSNVDFWVYGTAETIDELTSDTSDESNSSTMVIVNANPNAPGHFRVVE